MADPKKTDDLALAVMDLREQIEKLSENLKPRKGGSLRLRVAKFVEGVYLGNTVRQSISVEEGNGTGIGVYRVKSMEATPPGLVVELTDGSKHLVPWAVVRSAEVVP